MALKGNLRDFSLHQFFNLINLAHKTGALLVKPEPLPGSGGLLAAMTPSQGGSPNPAPARGATNGHSTPASLYFREGRLIHAAFDGKPARLTDILVQVGRLSPEQAQTVRARSRVDTDKELGLLLIHNGFLSQNDIIQGVRGYLLETVYQLFTWAAGDFRFEPNQLPPEERITVPLSLENVILEGSRRQQEWEKLLDEIPDLDVPLKFAERPKTNLRNISLTREEWQMISFINSRNTIKQIGEYIGLDDFQVRRVVYGLKQNGLIELTSPVRPDIPGRAPLPGVKLSCGVLLRIIDGIRRR